jgi:hypothetical protein
MSAHKEGAVVAVEEERRKKEKTQATGKEHAMSRNPRERKNGNTSRTAIRREQCDVPPKSRNIGVRAGVHC